MRKELTLEAKTEKLDEALDFINGVLEEAGCSMRTQTQIDVAAEEIFVNIAHYAYAEAADADGNGAGIKTQDIVGSGKSREEAEKRTAARQEASDGDAFADLPPVPHGCARLIIEIIPYCGDSEAGKAGNVSGAGKASEASKVRKAGETGKADKASETETSAKRPAEEKAARLTFCDCGRPYNPLEKPDPDITLSAEDRQIGGLGIFMVKKSMDATGYEYVNGENRFTMIKKV